MNTKHFVIGAAVVSAVVVETTGVASSATVPKSRIATQLVSAMTANDTAPVKTLDAVCPAGTVVTGGGYDFFGSSDVAAGVEIAANRPAAGAEGWTFAALNRSGINDVEWGFRVFAICAH